MTPTTRLRRAEAANYLRENYGIIRKPTTLAKLAVIGGGPKFQRAGRIPLYTLAELDVWAASILSPLVSSTSELRGEIATQDTNHLRGAGERRHG